MYSCKSQRLISMLRQANPVRVTGPKVCELFFPLLSLLTNVKTIYFDLIFFVLATVFFKDFSSSLLKNNGPPLTEVSWKLAAKMFVLKLNISLVEIYYSNQTPDRNRQQRLAVRRNQLIELNFKAGPTILKGILYHGYIWPATKMIMSYHYVHAWWINQQKLGFFRKNIRTARSGMLRSVWNWGWDRGVKVIPVLEFQYMHVQNVSEVIKVVINCKKPQFQQID